MATLEMRKARPKISSFLQRTRTQRENSLPAYTGARSVREHVEALLELLAAVLEPALGAVHEWVGEDTLEVVDGVAGDRKDSL